MDDRLPDIEHWLEALGYRDYRLSPASEDASFRRYLRLEVGGESLIVMDAPPELEPCDPFVKVAGMLREAGLNAPQVMQWERERGFLLLSDFGSRDYLSQLSEDNVTALYGYALDALLAMQTRIDPAGLPPYDDALLYREMGLFHDWFLGELLGIELDSGQELVWQAAMRGLADNSHAQPQVFVHRDYHSRNLMLLEQGNPGILDFQDAVRGPLTYDLVSLLRDCYIAWPAAQVRQLAAGYHQAAREAGLTEDDAEQFLRWFDLTGIQRHLKAIGIFSRLKIRDGKSRYLKDIPRTYGYLRQVASGQASMAGLVELIDQLGLDAHITALESA
jgi:N-acetylmuramate 1-kinase